MIRNARVEIPGDRRIIHAAPGDADDDPDIEAADDRTGGDVVPGSAPPSGQDVGGMVVAQTAMPTPPEWRARGTLPPAFGCGACRRQQRPVQCTARLAHADSGHRAVRPAVLPWHHGGRRCRDEPEPGGRREPVCPARGGRGVALGGGDGAGRADHRRDHRSHDPVLADHGRHSRRHAVGGRIRDRAAGRLQHRSPGHGRGAHDNSLAARAVGRRQRQGVGANQRRP